jgi:hypothetical protein
MLRTSSLRVGLFSAASGLLVGCADEPPSVVHPFERDDAAVSVEPDAGGVCEPGAEEPCGCPDGLPEGLRYCYDGEWLACSCEPPEEDGGVGPSSDCKPGRYEGEFWGYYFSSYTFGFAPIPVWAWNLSGEPGLAFTLNAKEGEVEEGGEFGPELEISDGYVKGVADGAFPFEGKLTGKLNCRTREFKATLTGGYSILVQTGTGLNEANFEGPVLGTYEAGTSSFPCKIDAGKVVTKCTDSVEFRSADIVLKAATGSAKIPEDHFPSHWDLKEETTLPQSPLYPHLPYGGAGYWSAEWVGEGNVDPNTGKPQP